MGVPINVARTLVRSVAPPGGGSNANKNSAAPPGSAAARAAAAQRGKFKEDIIISVYQHMGCFRDTPYWWRPEERAVKSVEGMYDRVTGDWKTRKDPIGKCADTAKDLGFKFFAIQNGGQCFTSADADKTYNKFGVTDKCKSGVGGPMVSDVYSL